MNKINFWGVALLLSASTMYIAYDILAPFLVAFIFAYLLQPLIVSCERFKLPRSRVVTAVFVVFLSIFISIVVLLVPIIYQQGAVFIQKVPQYKDTFEAGITEFADRMSGYDSDITSKVSDSMQSFINSAFTVFSSFANHIWDYTLATINFFVVVALVPVILYYFLRDWPELVSSVESVLPLRGKNKVHEIFTSINELLSAYIRGQLNICLMLAVFYTIGLHIVGLDLALLLGMLAGFLIIIPFIGAAISYLLCAISCYFSFGAGGELFYTTILFILGYVLEGYILTPKIIGDKIGLHPVWIMFAVFAAGSLFGILGIAFAIPIAGIIKVLLGHIIDYYKSTNIYKN